MQVFQHLARRLTFVDPRINMAVITTDEIIEVTLKNLHACTYGHWSLLF